MDYLEIKNQLHTLFDDNTLPLGQNICLEPNSFQYRAIEKNLDRLRREFIPQQVFTSLVFDISLLSDEIVLYYLPILFESMVRYKGHYRFLYSRLQNLSSEFLSQKQLKAIGNAIDYLINEEALEDEEI